jgi:hypothetical protein
MECAFPVQQREHVFGLHHARHSGIVLRRLGRDSLGSFRVIFREVSRILAWLAQLQNFVFV